MDKRSRFRAALMMCLADLICNISLAMSSAFQNVPANWLLSVSWNG